MESKTPWIVAHDGSHHEAGMECLRCGVFVDQPRLCPINVWIAMANAFLKDHKHCGGELKEGKETT
jgi:hypothetical protein